MKNDPFSLAKEICRKLAAHGYIAYFAGGWVRDLLLHSATDEIDIATSAPPAVVQKLFPRTIPVGISFGVVIVVMGDIHFEVATFRHDHPYVDGRHPEGVDFSTPEEDAKRRDFTINGMFFDPLTETFYDYVGGKQDLERKIIRAIGNPSERFAEDRLRMIRGIRLSARLGFHIEEQTGAAITHFAPTLFPSVSMERITQELTKMAAYGRFDKALFMLLRFDLLGEIFPALKKIKNEELAEWVEPFQHFSKETPLIVYLLELFPKTTLEERLNLCDYLKMSRESHKLTEFFTSSAALFNRKTLTPAEWAHFYAHPQANLFLEVQTLKIPFERREEFREEHTLRQQKLSSHVERLRHKKPLVTAAHLLELGIKPGKEMGSLLKKAESIAINEDCSSPSQALSKLQLP